MIMTLLKDIRSLVGMANITILVVLLVVYSRIFIKTRATFTIGLAVFAGMLMLHNGIAVYGVLCTGTSLFKRIVAVFRWDTYRRAHRANSSSEGNSLA